MNIGQDPNAPSLLDVLPPERYTLLPNTGRAATPLKTRCARAAGARTAGRPQPHQAGSARRREDLYPDVVQTLKAAEQLVADGFDVMVYTSDDPIPGQAPGRHRLRGGDAASRADRLGAGHQNKYNLLEIIENAKVPIIVDAGVGTASDAAIAMELGCDGVLMNTAIAGARDPILMASAMRKAIEAGREAFLAGRIPRKRYASASSPVDGVIG
ncbi:thiazole synthase [Xanthomonas citri]|uniref:thiazole synthase n=1 Tax=Xanthomonas citri TaxID=346 RepID=UPI003CCF4564